MRRRRFSPFSLSFLDCICCGFGAVILLYVIVNARSAADRDRQVMDLRGEVSRLEFELMKGERNLVQIRNSLDETTEEVVRTEGRSREIIELIKKLEEELAKSSHSTLATTEHVNKLKADLKSLEEELNRLQAAAKADEEGEKLREFKGVGDRHYVTGLKVGGERILILVDCSASMLSDKLVEIIRIRNQEDETKRAAVKWQQAVRTLDWLSTQLPMDSRFQVYGFNENAFAFVHGTDRAWLDAGNPDDLGRVVDAMREQVPTGGTSLLHAFQAVRAMPTAPDNIILLTDGLPTMGERRPAGYRVSARKRLSYFTAATGRLGRGIPVNVILYPMEGDPRAASAFWRLAIDTDGSFFCPAGDWP